MGAPYRGRATPAHEAAVPTLREPSDPTSHPDWLWPPSRQDVVLEGDIAHMLARLQAEPSELRRHAMWRIYAAKVRMRSDAELRRQAIVAAMGMAS